MLLRSLKRQCDQLPDFEKGRITGMRENGWSVRLVTRNIGHSYFTVCMSWDQTGGQDRGLLHVDQAQDALNRPIVEKTVSSYDTNA
ncbi:hypothetical protein TNCV_2389521 [Trichonephila clavipes]|nr:hypothetical protein TNCV_2389521 [Trichonephila clavipes]